GHGHGTHTTGTMVGDDGGSNQIGVAPGAQTIHCKNMTDGGSGSDATFIECFEWILAPWDLSGANPMPELAPHSMNNSWGYWGGGQPQFIPVIDNLHAAGILVEVSAGNEGPNCSTLRSPGDYEQVLTTGSVNHASGVLPGTLTGFSSRGPSSIHPAAYFPDIMAPGESIRSSLPGGSYASWSGTSMSGPHATALIGLMWSANPALTGFVEDTIELIIETAVPLSGVGGNNCGGDYDTGPNNDWGFGTIDALAAVDAAIAYGGSGTLEGTVTEAGTGDPIAGATILAVGEFTRSTTTNDDGEYSLILFADTYDVSVSRYGYVGQTETGVEVLEDQITVLDFVLEPADTYTVSGTVTDVNTGWPLYAYINIVGYPEGPVWTDPLTGEYSIDLVGGFEFTFHVDAWVDGYLTESRPVGPLNGNQTEDFQLDVDVASCVAPGYSPVISFFEDFEDGYETWTMSGLWNPQSEADVCGGMVAPFPSPINAAYYGVPDVCNFDVGLTTGSLTMVDPVSVPAGGSLTYWSFEETECGGNCFYDKRYTEVSIDGGTSWITIGEGDTEGVWHQRIFDLTPFAGEDLHLRFRFDSIDSIANNFFGWMVDDIAIATGCDPQPGSLIVGNVYDGMTGDGLVNASVSSDMGYETITAATPLDENVDDGFYTLFAPTGANELTASKAGYSPDSAVVMVGDGETIRQDFTLTSGYLEADPDSLEVDVFLGSSETVPLELINWGDADVEFEVVEIDGGFTPVVSRAEAYEAAPSIAAEVFTGTAPVGYQPNAAPEASNPTGPWQSLASAPFVSMDNVYIGYEGKGYQIGGYGTNGQVGIYDADTNSWTSGTSAPSPYIEYPVDGCFGFDAGGDPVGVLFNDTSSGVTTLHRYNIATDTWDTPPVPAGFPANGLWAHDIASVWRYTGENVCYISGGATTPGGGNTSALYAYYPDTNTVENLGNFTYLAQGFAFHGSWYVPWIGSQGGICVGGGVNAASLVSADTQCYDIGAGVFNAPNADLGALPAGLWGIADGILIENGDYQLWVAYGADTAFNLWPNSAYYSFDSGEWHIGPTPPRSLYRVEGVNIPASDGYSFYVVGGSSGGFTPTSGHERNYSSEFPSTDVPWLSADPSEGTVPAMDSITIDVTFDASVPEVIQPGLYHATLRFINDTPHGPLNVPVTMNVIPSETAGKLEGTVTSLGYCDADPHPLAGATVLVESFLGDTWELTTDADGYYQMWIDESYSPLMVTVTHGEHEGGFAEGVIIVGMETTTVDFDLRWLMPCLSVDPESLDVTLDFGDTTTVLLTLINAGAGEADFQIFERDLGYQPASTLIEGRGEWLYQSDSGVLLENNRGKQTLAYPKAYRWTSSQPSSIEILIYADDYIHIAPNTFLDQALQHLGLSYTAHYDGDFAGFLSSLASQDWDIVLFGNDNYAPDTSLFDALNSYVIDGGKLVLNTWTVSLYPGNPLWTTLGINWVSDDFDPPSPVYWWDPSHPAFTVPRSIPEFTSLTGGIYGTYGQRVEPLSGFEAIAGYTTPGPDPNQAAMVVGNDSRTVFKGFLDGQNDADLDSDGLKDGLELWINLIDGIQYGFAMDVPWLSADPEEGSVPADSTFEVEVTFDAGEVDEPGIYYAVLDVRSNDPANSVIEVPVSMTVLELETFGLLNGTVSSLGYCDGESNPLAGAEVFIESALGDSWTVTTDAEGFFYKWLDEAGSPYTLTVSADEHEGAFAEDVIIIGQETTTVDFDLRWLMPCQNVEPLELWAELYPDTTAVETLNVCNLGAGPLEWEIIEIEAPLLSVNTTVSLPAGPEVAPQRTAVAAGPFQQRPESTYSIQRLVGVLNGPDVLLVNADYDNDVGSPIQALLEAYGTLGSVDLFDARDATPSLALLQDYDVVLTWSNFVYADPIAMGNVLADYVDVGGKVVNLMFSIGTHGWHMQGRFMTEEYTAMNGTNIIYAESCLGSYDADHPIMAGVSNVCDFFRLDDSYLTANSTAISEWQDGQLFVAAKDDQSVVSIGGYVGEAYLWTGQMPDVLHNSILWLYAFEPVEIPWLSQDPTSGEVLPGECQEIQVTFDATDMEIGEYFAGLRILSNDPQISQVDIPVTMSVVEPPEYDLELYPEEDAQSGDPGETVEYNLTLTNTGTSADTFEVTY
ncbi:MAG: carboxypeptidase regulatory-like domain-containing protein, partial [Anaerolineales bacterium]|nr:carboxypeptidase regulatory-like domain-containing protein [Anaerolineales bacterium]